MKIGIDASRAFLKNRTGIEEYSYQITKHLTNSLRDEQVVLYVRKNQKSKIKNQDYKLKLKDDQIIIPDNWKVKEIKWPRFWTQLGLSLEMLFHPVGALLVPAHTVSFIHPKNTIVVVHGLEYEFCPEAYSRLAKFYMRWTIKKSCNWASKIISVSENTKRDLIRLYEVPEDKITVIYEGYEKSHQSSVISHQSKGLINDMTDYRLQMTDDKFILFVGRIEQRKNIANVVKAFNLLKEKYSIEHKLILAGRSGFGYEKIKEEIENSKYKNDIIELGYVGEQEKWELLKNADVFVFATFYEGFGIPVLEAQSVGCPVIAANNSSIPEVALDSASLVNANDPDQIAENVYHIISDETLRNAIIEKGLNNVKRFSWEKTSENIAKLLY